jgi:putative transposase
MNIRKDPLINGHYYHIYNRSIAKFIIFNDSIDYMRILEILKLYRYIKFNYKYSNFAELKKEYQNDILRNLEQENETLVDIIAYCIMPTHIHLILKQNTNNGISKFMSKTLNSYTRYFNIKHHRTGPLWVGHFKDILIKNDEQLLHLTRYIHLNPTSANLVKKPENWAHSSYLEYISSKNDIKGICNYYELFDLTTEQYQKFVNDRIGYQKDLSLIKAILIDEYYG